MKARSSSPAILSLDAGVVVTSPLRVEVGRRNLAMRERQCVSVQREVHAGEWCLELEGWLQLVEREEEA